MITRRSLGALLAGAAAWLGLGRAQASSAQALLSLFEETPSALGVRCLKALPGQTARQLRDAVMATCGATERQAVAARIRDDFYQGEIIDVDGWQLSLTEARLCALAALEAGWGV